MLELITKIESVGQPWASRAPKPFAAAAMRLFLRNALNCASANLAEVLLSRCAVLARAGDPKQKLDAALVLAKGDRLEMAAQTKAAPLK